MVLLRHLIASVVFAEVVLSDSVPQDIADKFGAKCLDGSAPTFELTRNVSSTSWVLFLEGGGWCQGPDENATLTSCAQRAGLVWPPTDASQLRDHDAGDASSAEVLKTRSNIPAPAPADIGGVMAQDGAVNPDFYTWNKVFIHYCDGASFGSSREEPINVSTRDGAPAQMWMRGRNNFDAVISYLQSDVGMGNATEVILSGGSAGGLAVFYNLDHLATLLPSNVRLTGFPDAGFFLDAADERGEYAYRAGFIGADPVWNVTGSGGTNLKCLEANPTATWKCLMAPYLASFITTPYFVMNAIYDAYQTANVRWYSTRAAIAQHCLAITALMAFFCHRS